MRETIYLFASNKYLFSDMFFYICIVSKVMWNYNHSRSKKKKKERKEKTKPYTRHQSHVVAVAINRKVKMSEKLTKLS